MEKPQIKMCWNSFTSRIITMGISLWILTMVSLCPDVQGRKQPKYPQPKFLPRMESVTVREGALARLPCAVHFLGTRQVTWRKIGGEHFISVGDFKWIKDTNIQLEFIERAPRVTEWNILILNTSKQDMGIYQCQISASKTLTQNITLKVVDPPVTAKVDRPIIAVSGKDYVDQGQPIHLYCNTTGPDHTHLRVDWFKDGDSIDSKDYRHIYVTNYNLVESKQLVSELHIDRSKASDSGTYICRSATNHIASRKVTVLSADTTNVKRDNPTKQRSAGGGSGHVTGNPIVVLIAIITQIIALFDIFRLIDIDMISLQSFVLFFNLILSKGKSVIIDLFKRCMIESILTQLSSLLHSSSHILSKSLSRFSSLAALMSSSSPISSTLPASFSSSPKLAVEDVLTVLSSSSLTAAPLQISTTSPPPPPSSSSSLSSSSSSSSSSSLSSSPSSPSSSLSLSSTSPSSLIETVLSPTWSFQVYIAAYSSYLRRTKQLLSVKILSSSSSLSSPISIKMSHRISSLVKVSHLSSSLPSRFSLLLPSSSSSSFSHPASSSSSSSTSFS